MTPSTDQKILLRAFAVFALFVLAMLVYLQTVQRLPNPAIRIGILHSLTGTMSVSETPLVAAVKMAVDEINADGGLLGRKLEVVVADSQSNPGVAAREAERLITQDKVDVVFGCWTSACRKAVRPVFERHHHLLFYPVQYEGLEQSPNIIYTGAAPNQQIVPGAGWAMDQFGPRVYLAGSDYVFPRTANLIIRDIVAARQGRILAEKYLPLGNRNMDALVDDIRRQKPDVLLSTFNGDSNAAFFKALADKGLSDLPLVSFSVAEPEMQVWRGTLLHRHYAVWSYFQSIDTANNHRFVSTFKMRNGSDAIISDPVETSYAGMKLWANAVRELGSSDPAQVNIEILHQSVEAPGDIAAIDAQTRHMWRKVRVGKVQPDGQFLTVFSTAGYIKPMPWPSYRDHEQWRALTGVAP